MSEECEGVIIGQDGGKARQKINLGAGKAFVLRIALPSFYSRLVVCFRQELGDSASKGRVFKLRRKLCQRRQHKAALVQARVRELQKFCRSLLVAVKQKV